MILGRYTPRLFLVTTPCYDFNQLFTPPPPTTTSPSSPQIRDGGYLDPTGRTTRVFRHSDHKFEWTHDEFTRWCTSQGEAWGYTVECGALGRAVDPDPWARDVTAAGHPLRATLTAIFRRLSSTLAAPTAPSSPAYPTAAPAHTHAHELILDITHPAHPASNAPRPLPDIRAALQACVLMRGDGDGAVEVCDAWADDAVARACGGALGVLFDAVDALVLDRPAEWAWDAVGRSRWRRRVVWSGYAEEKEKEEEKQRARERQARVDGDEHGDGDGDVPREDEEDEDSRWDQLAEGDQLGWETGRDGNMPDLGWGGIVDTVDEQEGGHPSADGGDAASWGSPMPVRAELDGDGWGGAVTVSDTRGW
jgi:hypothetical protein